MIEKLASNITYFYLYNHIIPTDEYEAYQYGFEILLSTLVNIIAVIIISVFFKSTPGAVVYMSAFIIMRSAGGGYHADNHMTCILSFSCIFTLFCCLNQSMTNNLIALYNPICTTASAIIIWIYAPVEAPNKPLSETKLERYRFISLSVGCGFMIMELIDYFTMWIPATLSIYLFSGQLAAALSITAGAIKNERRDQVEKASL